MLRISLAFLLFLAPQALAGDWPQILGPHRDGIADGEQPLKAWGRGGLRPKWSVPIGAGYAGPAVVGDRIVLFHRVDGQERIECLAADSGRSLWRADFPASYGGGVNPDQGPRCVPLIQDGRVVVFGAAGELHCVGLADGAKQWSVDAYTKYRGQEGYFGAGSTPLVLGNRVLVNVGGKNAAIVAFALETGKEVWASGDDRASYSSPAVMQLGGQPHAVFVTRLQCFVVHPETGKVAFQTPFGQPGPTVNAATPLILGDRVFLTASYGIGAELWDLKGKPRQVWANDDTLSSQYSTAVAHSGHLYGFHGREDLGGKELRCVVAESGEIRWRQPMGNVGHVVLVGDQLLVLTVAGELRLVAARPDAYSELAFATVSQGVTRALPAFSNHRLVLRDNTDDGGRLTLLELP